MLLSAVSVSVVAQSSSEIPEGLMNNPVHSENNTRNIPSLLVKHTETEYSCHSDILKIPVLTRLRNSLRNLPFKGVFSFSELAEYFSVTRNSGLLFKYMELSVAVCPYAEYLVALE